MKGLIRSLGIQPQSCVTEPYGDAEVSTLPHTHKMSLVDWKVEWKFFSQLKGQRAVLFMYQFNFYPCGKQLLYKLFF